MAAPPIVLIQIQKEEQISRDFSCFKKRRRIGNQSLVSPVYLARIHSFWHCKYMSRKQRRMGEEEGIFHVPPHMNNISDERSDSSDDIPMMLFRCWVTSLYREATDSGREADWPVDKEIMSFSVK